MMDGLKHSAMGSPAPVHVKERLFMEVHMVCTRGHYGFFLFGHHSLTCSLEHTRLVECM